MDLTTLRRRLVALGQQPGAEGAPFALPTGWLLRPR